MLGAHEHEHLVGAAADGGTDLHPVHLMDLDEAVLHLLDRRGGRGHLVEDRVVHVATDEAVDRAVEGGGEEQRLVVALEAAQHPLDLGHEAHVGHPVGLVEDQRLEVGDGQLATVAEVDEPARRGDDDVDAAPQLLDLALDVGSAVDGDGAQSGGLGQRFEHLAHLDGELTGGDEDERLGPTGLGRGGGHRALQQRHAEGQRLARAGLGLAADVAAGEGVLHGHGLDGERGMDALLLEGLDDGRVDAQLGEGLLRPGGLGGVVQGAIRWIGQGGHGIQKLSLIVLRRPRPTVSTVRVTAGTGPPRAIIRSRWSGPEEQDEEDPGGGQSPDTTSSVPVGGATRWFRGGIGPVGCGTPAAPDRGGRTP